MNCWTINCWTTEPVNCWTTELLNCWAAETLNYWTIEPVNCWTSELLNQWTVKPLNQWTAEPLNHRTIEPLHQWTAESLNYWNTEPVNCWTIEPLHQWTAEPLNQWTAELPNQWTVEPMNQCTHWTDGPLNAHTLHHYSHPQVIIMSLCYWRRRESAPLGGVSLYIVLESLLFWYCTYAHSICTFVYITFSSLCMQAAGCGSITVYGCHWMKWEGKSHVRSKTQLCE